MGKRRVIAETGAGQHGVATAASCARLGLACEVFMGAEDVRRQAPNVQRMRLFGATVRPVESGSRTLKDAMNEAIRDWVTNVETTFYVIGSVAGPHPYPTLVRDLQRVIGDEARAQWTERLGGLPDAVVACVGGGSNAMGAFTAFLGDPGSVWWRWRLAARGSPRGSMERRSRRAGSASSTGAPARCSRTTTARWPRRTRSSAGLDYPGVGPELAYLRDTGRLDVRTATDDEALSALQESCRLEGILPALETAHALARARDVARELGRGKRLLVNLSGRGDKDLLHVLAELERRAPGTRT